MSIVVACRQSIACRLYVVGGLAVLAFVLLAATSIYFAGVAGRTAEVLSGSSLVGVVEADELELLLEKHRRMIQAAPLEVDRGQLRNSRRASEAIFARIERLVAKTGVGDTGTMGQSLPELVRLSREILDLADNFAQEAGLEAFARYIHVADRIQEAVRVFRVERIAIADRATTKLARKGQALVSWVTLIAGAALLVIGPLSLVLVRGIATRLRTITEAMSRLARNDTSVSIEAVAEGDEINEMARAVEVFRANAVTLLDQKVRLEQLNLWLDLAMNNMARGLSMFDASRRLILSNAAYARLYELPPELVVPGTEFSRIIAHRKSTVAKIEDGAMSPADVDPVARARAIAATRSETRTSLVMQNGTIIEISIRPLPSGGWVALHEDVTERRRAADQIARLAHQDTLTGLANRLKFREQLARFASSLARDVPFAVHCIDLDRFKEVNDALGHSAGDEVLRTVAARLTSIVRAGDVVGRLGGDEFAIIQADVPAPLAAEELARRIIDKVQEPMTVQGQLVLIGATVGIALAPQDGAEPADLLQKADMALYRAKGDGRGRLSRFEPDMEIRLKARRGIELDLHRALEKGQLELHYQPILDLARRRVTGCEALIRWRHPERGLVPPGEFIPVAESIGLIPEIGAFAIRTASREASAWPRDIKVAVNLSPAQFGASDLVAVTSEALAACGLPASRLELEVTESLILDDNPETVETLHRLRRLGVRISLDDFGTGYSSLSYLRRFPFDKIKIDQSFVRDLSQRPDCVAIVGAVAQLARSLSMTTVAEGVETGDHLTKVQAAGCTEAQGYLFSKPVPADRIVAVIDACDRRIAGVQAVA